MKEGKKIYFASDVHLGAPGIKNHRQHEKRFVDWLDSIKESAEAIYLMGDIFDFWFEYKTVVPRGFTRFLGKLSEITDSGVPVYFFTGNHDIWIFDYLTQECGVKLYREEQIVTIEGKQFYLAHGDGLGKYDRHYNKLKWLFTNKLAQNLFGFLHPNVGMTIANVWSKKSREKNMQAATVAYLGDDKEWLVLHSKDELAEQHIDYFIYGHRHIARIVNVGTSSQIVHLGDWIKHFSYAEFDGHEVQLKFLENNKI